MPMAKAIIILLTLLPNVCWGAEPPPGDEPHTKPVGKMTLFVLPATAKEIPAQLPDPDGGPGDATKPVKVYILAGQSNMVGMGEIIDPCIANERRASNGSPDSQAPAGTT